MKNWNKTKIIATIGPASNNPKVLTEMLKAGLDVCRLNGAHGTIEEHKKTIKLIRKLEKDINSPVAIQLCLPGPKFRIGELKTEPVQYSSGESITLECGRSKQSGKEIPVPHKNLPKALKKGNTIYLNDGIIELNVEKIQKQNIICKVVTGGELRSKKGLNLPDANLNVPAITPKDRELVKLAISEKVDFVSLSFVRKAENIIELRKMLARNAADMKIIAKIEKPEALNDLENIIAASDAVMVARGDLGIEMRFNKIPAIQRSILLKCQLAGKPSITATQMMESMVNAKTPTRAEATDVANAVWEGSDAVMLSEETSIGKYPIESVTNMAKIAVEAEKNMPELPMPEDQADPAEYQAQSISLAANILAEDLDAKAIVVPTRSGRTALYISKQKPCAQIIATTPNETVARQLNLFWGIRPIIMPAFKTVDELLKSAEKLSLKSGYIKKGDIIVITSGAHAKKKVITRMIEVRKAGES